MYYSPQVFFRAGVLGLMEEVREEKISQILSWLQAAARGKMSRKTYRKLQQQKVNNHRLRTPRENFSFKNIEILGLGRHFGWNLWRHLGYFRQDYQQGQNVSKNLPKIAATEGNNHRLWTPRKIFFSNLLKFWGWADILVAFILECDFN